jgi:Domain of unknown function (DUF4440)/Outer membrane protein beta-barrel domain
MPTRKPSCGTWSLSSILLLLTFLTPLALPQTAQGQDLELGGGWSHVTGDNGTDGFNVGAAWWFTKRVTMAADYDSTWDTSSLTNFAFTQVGAIATKSHLQSFVLGPRVFFSTSWTDKHKLIPFGEAQFGVSHLSQKVTQTNMPSVSASDTAFSWMLGGGADYLLSPHWSGRANLDLLRTHLANEGQSRLRLVLGIRYTFGSRTPKIAPSSTVKRRKPEPTNSTTVLIGLEQRWADALQKADTATLEAILDDAYVDTDEMGRPSNKQELIAALRSGDLKINSIKLSGMQVRDYGTSAIVTGRAIQEGSFKGQPLTDVIVFSDTFVMQNGTWKAVASHRSVSHDTPNPQ